MSVDDVSQIRNIGTVGQGGCGKTSLADAMIFTAGGNTRQGRTDDGSSLFDFEPEEVRRKLSLTTSFHDATWKKHRLTVVDTPGYANFLPDAINCMRACTGLVFVFEPSAGAMKVEAERLWARAEELKLPRIGFVTKLDRENADFEAPLRQARETLQAKPVAVQIPIGVAADFRGVIDLLHMKAQIGQADGSFKEEAIPAALEGDAKAARDRLCESVAEVNDELLEQYLDSGNLSDEQVRSALREGTRTCRIIPVFCGAAARNIGTATLLDAIVELLPSPADLGSVAGEDPRNGDPVEREPSANAPFSAFVFKTIVDPFAGKLSVFRVVSGALASDSTVLNVNKDSKERIGTILKLEGKKQQGVPRVIAGEIAAIAKLRDTAAGDTLADEKAPIRYPGILEFPTSISFAVEPKSKGDEEKVTAALHKIMDEDSTLKMERDPQTKEIILSGVGQLHIELTVERLKRKYGVEVELKSPKVPYKETIKGSAKAQGKYKKQTGGRGQFGDTWIEIQPLPRGTGFQFEDNIVGGVIPRQYIPAVEKGIRDALPEGFLAGYELVDLKVKLYDGSFHAVDSSEIAFKIAGSMGFKNALQNAKPVLLEPIMTLEVMVPDEYMGDVIGDLNSRRGKVLGVDPKPGGQVIRAHVPMAEVLRYAPDLRSMTSGRGDFTMAFARYEEVPPHLAEKIIKEAEARKAAHHQ